MLNLFRKNLFFNIVLLALFAIGLMSFYLFDSRDFQLELAPLFNVSLLDNKYLYLVFSLVLIFTQAILISRLVISHRLSQLITLIPGALFILYTVSILEPYIFHYILVANLFFLLSIDSLFKIYKKFKPISTLFNAGFYLGVASLFYLPYSIFLIALLIGLNNLRSLDFKESLQSLFGFLSALFLAGVGFYFFDKLDVLLSYLKPEFIIPTIDTGDYHALIKPGLAILTVFLLLLFHNNLRKKKKYDSIRKIELTYSLFLLAGLSIFFTSDITTKHLFIISLPISIIGGLVLETKNYYYVKEFLFLLLIGLFVAFRLDVI